MMELYRQRQERSNSSLRQNEQTILNRQLMFVTNTMLAGARGQLVITLYSLSVTLAWFKCSIVQSG